MPSILNKEKHQLVMGRILRDIYSDTTIAPLLGFKGGTCAYFFYGLTRFSVDLDFDLLKPEDETSQKSVFDTVKSIIERYGDTDHNVKLEINTRLLAHDIRAHYDLKEYLGISMMVAKKDYLFASKLIALTARSETAMRDIYDIWFFAKDNWDMNIKIVETRAGKNIKEYLTDCITAVEQVKDNQIMHGLGELISEKDKVWVKNNLRKEVIFLLKNYQSVLK